MNQAILLIQRPFYNTMISKLLERGENTSATLLAQIQQEAEIKLTREVLSMTDEEIADVVKLAITGHLEGQDLEDAEATIFRDDTPDYNSIRIRVACKNKTDFEANLVIWDNFSVDIRTTGSANGDVVYNQVKIFNYLLSKAFNLTDFDTDIKPETPLETPVVVSEPAVQLEVKKEEPTAIVLTDMEVAIIASLRQGAILQSLGWNNEVYANTFFKGDITNVDVEVVRSLISKGLVIGVQNSLYYDCEYPLTPLGKEIPLPNTSTEN